MAQRGEVYPVMRCELMQGDAAQISVVAQSRGLCISYHISSCCGYVHPSIDPSASGLPPPPTHP